DMEITATAQEIRGWLTNHPAPFCCFVESRDNSVRMFDKVPEKWLKSEAPVLSAQPGEFVVFQVAVWTTQRGIKLNPVEFTDVTSDNGARIPAAALRCFQSIGTDVTG